MTARGPLRAGLVVLAAMQAFVGVWALPAPRSFYDTFPLRGHAWVALHPPYNEHLVRDVGAYSLAFAVLLGAAALSLDRRLARAALLALAVFAVPHAVFHAGHLEGSHGGRRGADRRHLRTARAPGRLVRADLAAARPRPAVRRRRL